MTTWVRPRRPDRLTLVAGATLWLSLVATPVLAAPAASPASGVHVAPNTASAADTTASEDQLVHELVRLTDVSQLQNVFTQQFIDRVSGAMSLFGGAMDEQTLTAIQDQTRQVVSARLTDGDALYNVLAPIYEKHFNIVELNQLVTFYQSPLGQKLVRISPQLLTESLDLGQQWGLSLVPEIVSRVRMQLNGQNPGPVDAPEADTQTNGDTY